MLASIAARLSYANVVATLALFVALGGSSYAALSITSKDVKNRSLTGADLRKNTITGTEVNESKLRSVPRARQADNASTAGTATTAGSAQTAAAADTARDAQTLAGQGAGDFEKSSRTVFGRTASFAPAIVGGEASALNIADMGIAVTSATNQGACGAGEIRVAVKNTRSSGPAAGVFGSNGAASVPAGGKEYYCSDSQNFEASLVITESGGKSIWVRCAPDAPSGGLVCLGVRSAP
jgi:hypothetical protein